MYPRGDPVSSLGAEIWHQTKGEVDVFVMGAGEFNSVLDPRAQVTIALELVVLRHGGDHRRRIAVGAANAAKETLGLPSHSPLPSHPPRTHPSLAPPSHTPFTRTPRTHTLVVS